MLDRFDVDSPGHHAPEGHRPSGPVLCSINHISRPLPSVVKLWINGFLDVTAPLS